MKKSGRIAAVTASALIVAMVAAGCGGSSSTASTAETKAAAESSGEDLNSKSLDDIIEDAKAEGDVQSVGMPDNWADWASLWKNLKDNYGITHTDADILNFL